MNNKGNFLISQDKMSYMMHLYKVNRPYMSNRTCVTVVSQRVRVSEAVVKRVLQREGIYY